MKLIELIDVFDLYQEDIYNYRRDLGDLISDRYMEDKTTKKMGQQLTPRSGGALLQEGKYDHGPHLTL